MCKIRKRSISVVHAICYKFMRYDIDMAERLCLALCDSKTRKKKFANAV